MKKKLSILCLTMGLINGASASDILASKKGPFENYGNCTLSTDKGVLEIKHGSKFRVSETTKLDLSQSKITKLALPAIEGIGGAFYRWFPTQTDYLVKNSDQVLVNFFSTGFRNLRNESNEGAELISVIDEVCDEKLNDFRILGEFQVDLKIGDRVFADKLIIKRDSESYLGARIEGLYIVPNSFESKIKEIIYENGVFSFVIRVQEGDDDYEAIFEGSLNQDDLLEGKAFVLPNRELLGTFTGKRL